MLDDFSYSLQFFKKSILFKNMITKGNLKKLRSCNNLLPPTLPRILQDFIKDPGTFQKIVLCLDT